MSKKQKLNNVLFAIGVLSVVVMFFATDLTLADLVANVRRAGYWLPCAIVLWGLLYCLNAVAWRVIIESDGKVKVGFGYILKLTISGFALNSVTPMGVLGGEPYRIVELSGRIGTERATSSVLLFSMMHIFSHFWYWLTAIVTFLILVAAGLAHTNTLVNTVLLLAALFCFVGIYFFIAGYKYGMVAKFFRLVARIPGLRRRTERFAERNGDRFKQIDAQIAALHSQNKRAFAGSFLLEYVGRLLQSFEILFILLLMGQDYGGTAGGLMVLLVKSFVILAFTSLLSNILGFIPMQVGGREGGFALSVSHMDMSLSTGLSVGIFCRIRELVWIVIGLALMKMGNKK